MDHIWRFALDGLRRKKRVTLLTVVENIGSVPGKLGAKLVLADDDQMGTVGGGAAESKVVEKARTGSSAVEIVEIHHDGDGIGSICAGSQKIAIVRLTPKDTPAIEEIVSTLSNHGFGKLTLSGDGVTFAPAEICEHNLTGGNSWTYQTVEGFTETLTVVGGGHVCLALSRVMAALPFKLIVLDDRPGLAMMESNAFAHEKHAVSYEDIARHVPQGDRCYAVIMTHGHLSDELVLGQLATGKFTYLGMMGSKNKIAKIYDNLEESGVPRASLDRVRSPIGLTIGSHSPEEIAISIAAELIAVKNGVR